MPSKDAAKGGRLVENAAARRYNLELPNARNKWWDATYASNGRKVQIKAARQTLSNDRNGHFRLWKPDHEKLKRAHGSYIFGVYHAGRVVKLRKVSPRRIDDLVTHGVISWYTSSHEGKHNALETKITHTRIG